MKQSFLLANFLLILYVCTACTSSRTAIDNLPSQQVPILYAEENSQKYNLQFDFMKQHLSGLLLVRQLPDNEIRIIASTYFGLSLFDFSLHNQEFRVNSCIEPLRKKNVLRLLEADFKHLWLSQKNLRIQKSTDVLEKRTTGRGFGKSVFYLSKFVSGHPEQILIKHPWLRIRIQLDKLPAKQETTVHP